jgi:hypothetical protein
MASPLDIVRRPHGIHGRTASFINKLTARDIMAITYEGLAIAHRFVSLPEIRWYVLMPDAFAT